MKTRLLVALMILASLLLTVSGSAAARADPQSGISAPAPSRSGKPAENPQAVVLGQSGTSFAYSQTFGSLQTPYLADTSHLNYPWGIATDGTNVLIGELAGHRVLTYTSAGTWVSTLGQPGITYGDGNFSGVFDMAVDGSGTTWVAENGRAEIYQFDSGGNYLGEFKDGSFEHPSGIAFDAAGNVYVSDGGTTWSDDQGRQVVGVYDSSGNLLSTIGVADTSGSGNDKFHGPQHIAVYANMLYVADGGNNRVQIFDITDPTKPVYSATLGVTGEYGSDNTHLSQPVGVAVDASSIYVADRWNNRVQVFSRSTHVYAATLGSGSGTGDDQFSNPSDVAVDSSGNLYVADYDNNRVQQFNSSFVYQRTYGVTGVPYLTDAYHYNYPSGIATASDGSFYVTEDTGQRLIKLDAAGGVEWTLGTAGVAVSPMTNSSFNQPTDVALDSGGNVYVADQWNQRVQEYDSGGNYLATLGLGAGNYEFQEPAGLAIGPNGYIYVADSGRNRVQVFDASRNYLATLGETDVSGTDNAHFNWPRDVAVDSNGQLYVMDTNNDRVQVFDASRTYLRTLGVTGEPGGANDHFQRPEHVATDSHNRLYVSDLWNNRVQVYDSSGGYLTTLGGTFGTRSSQFVFPMGLAVDPTGNLIVADNGNHRIQKFALGVPNWVQSNLDGFGDPSNDNLQSLTVFKGQLYAGMHNGSGNGAQVWRSSDGRNWSAAMTGGFGNGLNSGIDDLAVFNGSLYAGTLTDGGNGAQIWRSPDGTTWEQVVSNGFGDSTQGQIMHFVEFNGQLYASAWRYGGTYGGEVWRSATGNAGDWSISVENGFGDKNNSNASAGIVFGNKIYLGTFNTTTGSQIWRSATGNDGDWTQVDAAGFGDGAHNGGVINFASFNGKLYASTTNCDEGGQVWSSSNGTTWDKVVDAGFGDINNCVIEDLVVSRGYLYAATNNHPWNSVFTGSEVWRTADGSHWEQMNIDGFGNSANTGPYWGNSMAVFGDRVFFGMMNNSSGGEIWRDDFPIQVLLPLVIR